MSENDKHDKIDTSDAGGRGVLSPSTGTEPGATTVLSDSDSAENRHNLNRFYHEGGSWFVDVREGKKGPFVSRDEAVEYLERYKRNHGWNRE
jgi:hypothetical protein